MIILRNPKNLMEMQMWDTWHLMTLVAFMHLADDGLLSASPDCDLGCLVERFEAECDAEKRRIAQSRWGGSSCHVWRSPGEVLWSDVTKDGEIDHRLGASAGRLYEHVVLKWELSYKVKISIYQSVLIQIPTWGKVLWTVTERVRLQTQGTV